MKIRVITADGKVKFLEEHITRNVHFMKKYGLRVEHLAEQPEAKPIKTKPIEPVSDILGDGFVNPDDVSIPESIIQPIDITETFGTETNHLIPEVKPKSKPGPKPKKIRK